MKMVKSWLGLGIFVAVCVLSYNYVENHVSTTRKQLVKEQRAELDKTSLELITLKDDRNDLREKVKQACFLMSQAEIDDKGVVCEKEEAEEQAVVESEDSDA